MTDLLTVTQAAKIADRHASTIRWAIKHKRIQATKYGPRLWLIERADLQRWIDDDRMHEKARGYGKASP